VRHLISNVQVLETPDTDTAKVASNFLVFKSRRNREENLFVGCREDIWRRNGGAWKLEERMVLLDHNVIENITVLF
jgi:3-phenylpropionate/trans-cinnamate dioxygenase subunit beta